MRRLISIVFLCLAFWLPASLSAAPTFSTSQSKVEIPAAAKKTLDYVRAHKEAPPGQVGGRKFGNYEKRLPMKTPAGKRIIYQEWDIYPKMRRRNRGPERLVTGSDGRAWYTADHYNTFTEIP